MPTPKIRRPASNFATRISVVQTVPPKDSRMVQGSSHPIYRLRATEMVLYVASERPLIVTAGLKRIVQKIINTKHDRKEGEQITLCFRASPTTPQSSRLR